MSFVCVAWGGERLPRDLKGGFSEEAEEPQKVVPPCAQEKLSLFLSPEKRTSASLVSLTLPENT